MLSGDFNQKIVELYLGFQKNPKKTTPLKKAGGGGVNPVYVCLYLLIFIL